MAAGVGRLIKGIFEGGSCFSHQNKLEAKGGDILAKG